MTNFIVDINDVEKEISWEAIIQLTNNTDTAVTVMDYEKECFFIYNGIIKKIEEA